MTRRVNWVGSRKVRGKATATNGTSDHPRRTDSLAGALLGCACRRHTARRFLLASLIGARLLLALSRRSDRLGQRRLVTMADSVSAQGGTQAAPLLLVQHLWQEVREALCLRLRLSALRLLSALCLLRWPLRLLR